MKSAPKIVFVVSIFALLALALVTPGLAQDQINLNDGVIDVHLNGAGSTHISMLIPAPDCSGGTCTLANSTANGTGNLLSSGTYTVTTPATTCDGFGNCDGPFYLTVQADGSSIVTQTGPMTFVYNSPQGTLTGLLYFSTVSATNNQLKSTMLGTLAVTGGTFAPYFPNGSGNVNITLGLTFPLQILWKIHGFSSEEFYSGTIVPAQTCPPYTQGYWKNHLSQWKDGPGLTLGTTFYTNDQLVSLLKTPAGGDASLILGHQLIAALLNIANGTDGTPVESTIVDSDNLIGAGSLPENISTSSPIGQQMVADSVVLDNYNNGKITDQCAVQQ
jgi:hypothetical protein